MRYREVVCVTVLQSDADWKYSERTAQFPSRSIRLSEAAVYIPGLTDWNSLVQFTLHKCWSDYCEFCYINAISNQLKTDSVLLLSKSQDLSIDF